MIEINNIDNQKIETWVKTVVNSERFNKTEKFKLKQVSPNEMSQNIFIMKIYRMRNKLYLVVIFSFLYLMQTEFFM